MPWATATHKPVSHGGRVHRTAERDRQAMRALPTNSAAWRRLRARILAGEPLCRACARTGLLTPATDVDHEDGDATNNDEMNLQPLCHRCHSTKTAAENGGFGNRKARR